jgi:hypothetical protein
MTPERQRAWLRLWIVLALVVCGAALVSPWLALMIVVVFLGGYLLLRFVVLGAFEVVIWVLGKWIDIGTAAFDAAMRGPKGELSGISAEIAWHAKLMRARYPERYADVEKETYDKRSAYFPDRPPFDHEGTLARYRAMQDELVQSPERFIEELRVQEWLDADEQPREEEKIRELRRDLLRERHEMLGSTEALSG